MKRPGARTRGEGRQRPRSTLKRAMCSRTPADRPDTFLLICALPTQQTVDERRQHLQPCARTGSWRTTTYRCTPAPPLPFISCSDPGEQSSNRCRASLRGSRHPVALKPSELLGLSFRTMDRPAIKVSASTACGAAWAWACSIAYSELALPKRRTTSPSSCPGVFAFLTGQRAGAGPHFALRAVRLRASSRHNTMWAWLAGRITAQSLPDASH